MLRARRFWLGFGVSAGFLFLFLWNVDLGKVGQALQDADYSLVLPAILIYFIALGCRSLRWHYLLAHLKPIPPHRLFPVVAIAYMANNILPARLGELVRAHFLGEREQVSKASGLATIGVERVLDGLTLLILAAVIWPFLPWTDVLKTDGGFRALWVTLSVLVALAFVVAFLVLLLIAKSPGTGQRLACAVSRAFPPGLRPKVRDQILLVIEGLGALRSPGKLVLISLLSLPIWLLEATTYYLIAVSFDLGQPFQVIMLVTATSNLATAVPLSIGGIGPFEVVAKSTLITFGPGTDEFASLVVLYVIFVHIVALWLPVNILGTFFLWKEKKSLASLVKTGGLPVSASPGTQTKPLAEYGDGPAIAGEGEGE